MSATAPTWVTIVAALEALEAGDVDLCTAILLGALEDGQPPAGVHCRRCGFRADWPGLLDAHRCSGYLEAAA
jgi:hypothetical protein